MAQERLPKQALHAKANGRRPVGRPRTRWSDYIEDLGCNRLGLRPSEMMEVMEDREVWRLNLELLPPQLSRKSGQWRKKKIKLIKTFIKIVGTLQNILFSCIDNVFSKANKMSLQRWILPISRITCQLNSHAIIGFSNRHLFDGIANC